MLRFHASIVGSDAELLTTTFDWSLVQLQQLPRMFIEPDGSFVWTGEADGQRWQVDGNLIDRGDVLAYVDLAGRCPAERFDELLRAFGWPDAPLAFEITRQGLTLQELEFRALAESADGAV